MKSILKGIQANPQMREQVVALVGSLSAMLRLTAPTLTDAELATVLHHHGWHSWTEVLRTLS